MSRGGWLLVALALALGGCGYRPASSPDVAPRIQRLHVGAFTNETFRPGLDGVVSGSVLRRLQLERRLTVVAQPGAEAVLSGAVRSYENDPIAFQPGDVGQRFRVRVFVTARVSGRDGPLLMQEVVGEAFYTAAAAVTGTRAAEEDAIRRAAQDLAERLVGLLADAL